MKTLTWLISLLAFALVFVAPNTCVAQGDAPSCTLCATVVDGTCSSYSDCTTRSGVEATNFTAPCTGQYTCLCKVACPNQDDCTKCVCCSWLKDSNTGQTIDSCHAVNDAQGHCEVPCELTGRSVGLIQGHAYVLLVTLYYCHDSHDCTACALAGCWAKARVYYPGSTCDAF